METYSQGDGPARRLPIGPVVDAVIAPQGSVARNGAIAFVGTETGRPDELYYLAPNAQPQRITDVNAEAAGLQLGREGTVEGTDPDQQLAIRIEKRSTGNIRLAQCGLGQPAEFHHIAGEQAVFGGRSQLPRHRPTPAGEGGLDIAVAQEGEVKDQAEPNQGHRRQCHQEHPEAQVEATKQLNPARHQR